MRILAVVSWRSNNVRPQEGQEIYSVFEIRVRVACRILNAVSLTSLSGPQFSAAINTPSPKPSISNPPISVAAYNCNCSAVKLPYARPIIFYGLPEGTRGIFVGGGGSVRISRLLGTARMTDMMLTGRVFDADEGQAIGISNYRVADGQGLAKALSLAQKIAANAPLSNYAITQALPRIADLPAAEGLFVESLMAAIAESDEGAKERVRAFLEKRAAKVSKPS